MVAICLPTWNRIEFTKECISSFLEHTDFSLVTKYKIFDNNSTDGTLEHLTQNNIPFTTGNYNTAWKGFNQLHSEIIDDPKIKYIGKVDNDVIFTKPWIADIIQEFTNNPKIGSIRYGTSGSNGRSQPLNLTGGKHGGLKLFKKELFIPITKDSTWVGSTSVSNYILTQEMYCSSMEVGVCMADVKYPQMAKLYPKSIQRKIYGKI